MLALGPEKARGQSQSLALAWLAYGKCVCVGEGPCLSFPISKVGPRG